MPAWTSSAPSPSPAGRPTMARTRSACRSPPSFMASSTTRRPSTSSASKPPATEDEFFAVLEKIKRTAPISRSRMGTKDQWEAATMGYQNIGPNYWKGEEGRLALIAGKQKLTDRAMGRAVQDAGQMGALHGRRLPGAGLSRQPEPVHARPRRDLSGRLLGNRRLQSAGQVQDGRLPAAGEEGRRHLLHLRPCRHRARHQRQVEECRGGQDLPHLGGLARVRHASTPTRCRASSACSPATSSWRTRWPRSSSPGARSASRPSARPTRSCRAARRTSRTRPGAHRPTSSTARPTPEDAPKKLQKGLDSWYKPAEECSMPSPRRRSHSCPGRGAEAAGGCDDRLSPALGPSPGPRRTAAGRPLRIPHAAGASARSARAGRPG